MYTLRKIMPGKAQQNIGLGNVYTIVKRETEPEEFLKDYDSLYNKPDNKTFTLENINSEIYALVTSEGGSEVYPLYKNEYYYIVTDTGKTFSNLTFK